MSPIQPERRQADTESDEANPAECEAIITRFLDAHHAGLSFSLDDIFREHPQHEGELREFFESFQAMERLTGPTASFAGSASQIVDGGQTLEPASQLHPESHQHALTGALIGGCELLEEIGRGGMGVVYRARHLNLNRVIAIKMILGADPADEALNRRFRAEAQAAAALEHSGIVPIYDVGDENGLPYYTMAWVDGPSLAKKLIDGPLSTEHSADIVRQVAEALAYAHSKGIVHRDIKPGNILIDARGKALVADFGLAKQTGHADLTTTGQILGTPNYISPEQVRGGSEGNEPAVDIYSLGAVLYCLLTGRPPFQTASLVETLEAVKHFDPVPPRSLNANLPVDLETIALKCLEKFAESRYQSALALAEDLARYQAGIPIHARPANAWTYIGRWCKRNPTVAALSALVLTLLLTASVVSTMAAARFRKISQEATDSASEAISAKKLAQSQSAKAERSELKTRHELARSEIHQAQMTRLSHRVGQRTEALARVREAQQMLAALSKDGYSVPASDHEALRDEAASALLLVDVVTESKVPGADSRLPHHIVDQIHRRFVQFPNDDGGVILRSLDDGRFLDRVAGVRGSEDQFSYAAVSTDGTRILVHTQSPHVVDVWNIQQSPPQRLWTIGTSHMAVFSNARPWIGVTGHDDVTRFLDRDTGNVVRPSSPGRLPGGNPFSPRGTSVVLQRGDHMCVVDLTTDKVMRQIDGTARKIDWSADEQRLLIVRPWDQVEIFDPVRGTRSQTISELRGGAIASISSSQQFVLGTDWYRTNFIWDLNVGTRLLTFSSIRSTDTMPLQTDGRHLSSLEHHPTALHSLSIERGRMREFCPSPAGIPAVSHNGRWIASATADQIGIFDLESGRLLVERSAPGHESEPLGFEKDDSALWVSSGLSPQGRVLRWPITSEALNSSVEQLQLGDSQTMISRPAGLPWSGSRGMQEFLMPQRNEVVEIVTLRSNPSVDSEARIFRTGLPDVRHAKISPDGRWIVAGSHVIGSVAAFNLQTGERVTTLLESGGWGYFSPDSQFLAVGHFSGMGRIWDVATWRPLFDLPGNSPVFSPDSRMVAVEADDGGVVLLETSSGRKIIRLETADPVAPRPVVFSRNNQSLILTARDPQRLLRVDLAGLRDDLKKLDFALGTWGQ